MQKLSHALFIILRELPQIILFTLAVIFITWLSCWLPKDIGHPEFSPVLTVVYMVMVFAAASHLARRMLFHNLDLTYIWKQASTTSIGSAIIFATIGFITGVVCFCCTLMLH